MPSWHTSLGKVPDKMPPPIKTPQRMWWGGATHRHQYFTLSLQDSQNTHICPSVHTHTHTSFLKLFFFKISSALSLSAHTGMSTFVDKQFCYLLTARIQKHRPIKETSCYHRLYYKWCLISRHPSLLDDKMGNFEISFEYRLQDLHHFLKCVCVCAVCIRWDQGSADCNEIDVGE